MELSLTTVFDYDKIDQYNFDSLQTLSLFLGNNKIGKIDFMYYSSGFIKIINFDVVRIKAWIWTLLDGKIL